MININASVASEWVTKHGKLSGMKHAVPRSGGANNWARGGETEERGDGE